MSWYTESICPQQKTNMQISLLYKNMLTLPLVSDFVPFPQNISTDVVVGQLSIAEELTFLKKLLTHFLA